MGGGGQLVGLVAEAELDVAQQLAVGDIDQVLGHLAEGLLGGGSELVHQGTNAGFTAIGGRRRF